MAAHGRIGDCTYRVIAMGDDKFQPQIAIARTCLFGPLKWTNWSMPAEAELPTAHVKALQCALSLHKQRQAGISTS